MADLQNTLQGQSLTAPTSATPQEVPADENDPEVQRIRGVFGRLSSMIDQGQLRLNDDVRKMFEEEASRQEAEPQVAPMNPLQAAGAAAMGIMGSSLTGQSGIAEQVLSTVEQRRRESLASQQTRVGGLRDLHLSRLKAEADMALRSNDVKTALKKEEEIGALNAKNAKDERARKEEEGKVEHQRALEKIRATYGGKESLARLNAALKTDQLQSLYSVPKHVAQAMERRRMAIQTSTDAYIRALGGLAMLTEAKKDELKARENADMDASDRQVLQDYADGKLTPSTPGAGAAASPTTPASPRQGKIDAIRAAATGG